MSAKEKAGFDLFQTIGDVAVGVEIFIKDSPAIRAAILKAADDPVIMAGVIAALDAGKAWIQHLKKGAVAIPAIAPSPITVPQVIEVLQSNRPDNDPAGHSQPGI